MGKQMYTNIMTALNRECYLMMMLKISYPHQPHDARMVWDGLMGK